MKPVGKTRVQAKTPRDMLPRRTLSQTYQHVSSMKITNESPWILQQYVTGEEYCTHSVVVKGEVKAFVSCPVPPPPFNYQALPFESGLSRAMLNFTQAFAKKAAQDYTGHLSFKFQVEEQITDGGLQKTILPVECRPQAHTAAILFTGTRGSINLVRAYMAALAPSSSGINGYSGLTDPDSGEVAYPRAVDSNVYFIGQDAVSLVMRPLLQLLKLELGLLQFFRHCVTFLNHILFWREGTYELWDPLPCWWLHHVYLPLQVFILLWT